MANTVRVPEQRAAWEARRREANMANPVRVPEKTGARASWPSWLREAGRERRRKRPPEAPMRQFSAPTSLLEVGLGFSFVFRRA